MPAPTAGYVELTAALICPLALDPLIRALVRRVRSWRRMAAAGAQAPSQPGVLWVAYAWWCTGCLAMLSNQSFRPRLGLPSPGETSVGMLPEVFWVVAGLLWMSPDAASRGPELTAGEQVAAYVLLLALVYSRWLASPGPGDGTQDCLLHERPEGACRTHARQDSRAYT